jgi:hypothetical protein
MNDLVAAISIVSLACVAFLLIGRHFTAETPGKRMLVITNTLLMVVYFTCFWDRPILARLIPASALIVLSNWLPVLGCFYVGAYIGTSTISFRRRFVLAATALACAAYSLVAPTLGTAPECRSLAANESLQYQSTPFTCSAASAASLLRLHGIEASEAEMAELCLTRNGTHWMGLYRGLKMKTRNTNWEVDVRTFSPDLYRESDCLPAIFALNIDTKQSGVSAEYGFRADTGHTIVALEHITAESMVVFDPAPEYGVEIWSAEVFDTVKSGVILQLIPKDPATLHDSAVSQAVKSAIYSSHAIAEL